MERTDPKIEATAAIAGMRTWTKVATTHRIAPAVVSDGKGRGLKIGGKGDRLIFSSGVILAIPTGSG